MENSGKNSVQDPAAEEVGEGIDAANGGGRVIRAVAREPGRRLDAWLRSHYPHVPKNLAQKLVRKGYVRINGRKGTASQRLAEGDRIALPRSFLPPSPGAERGSRKTGLGPAKRVPPSAGLIESLRASVCYEDESYIFMNKPAGLCVHPGSGIKHDLASMLRHIWPELPYLELAHRLDKDTSGCLVLAKSWQSLSLFHESLRERKVAKEYLAALHLPVDFKRMEFAASRPLIDRERLKGYASQWRQKDPLFQADGRELAAETSAEVIERLANADLAKITIATGRHHQIRRHMASARRPIVGDYHHGLGRRLERRLGLEPPRMLLHSWRIAFEAVRSYAVECPVPADMQNWIEERRG